ncbi:MAG: DUF3320 domain-containing protein [Myxococcales bacterium]
MGGDVFEDPPADATIKRALKARLEAAGYAAELNVGIGRFRLDLAVANPDAPGTYALGLELDGARFAATDTARDRDRLRWESLTSLGWRHLCRVRALDWHESADRVVSEVTALIAKARQDAAQLAALPEPPVPTPSPQPEPAPAPASALAPEDAPEPAVEEAPAFVAQATDEEPYRTAKLAPQTSVFAWTLPEVPDLVAEIVAVEGPISERLLCRRVAEIWGLKRSPAGFGSALARLLARAPAQRRPTWNEGFLWPAGASPDTWRHYRVANPADPVSRRDAEDIAVEELANAAESLLARYGAMPREELARALAKRFGFRGLTRGVHQRMEEGIALAEKRAGATPEAKT